MQPGTSEVRTDQRKQTAYFPGTMLEEIKGEAARQGRSVSWIVQRAWKVAKERIRAIPAPPV